MLFYVPVEVMETRQEKQEKELRELQREKEIQRMILLERREQEMEKEGDF